MLGTLIGALEVRGVSPKPESITATVEGINTLRDGVPRLSEIAVHYTIRIASDQRDTLERALQRHQSKCPSAQTLVGAVEVRWTAEIEEEEVQAR